MNVKDPPFPETPSQTAGPYVHIGCMPNASGIQGVFDSDPGSCMVNEQTEGERVVINGVIYDGDGMPVKDAVVELWQADAAGIYPDPDSVGDAQNVTGWGRCAADFDTGEYSMKTIRPGRVPFTDGRLQAPHITLWIVARGINLGLHTRLYFADESVVNEEDPVLGAIEPKERRQTLLASPQGDGKFRFDIFLQGPNETVFLDM